MDVKLWFDRAAKGQAHTFDACYTDLYIVKRKCEIKFRNITLFCSHNYDKMRKLEGLRA